MTAFDARRPKGPATPDPGVVPGGVRDRALRGVLERGPVPEYREKTKASQGFRRHFREGQKLPACAEKESARFGRLAALEVVIKKTTLPTPHLAVFTIKIADPHRLQPFETFVMDEVTGEVTNLTSFVSIAGSSDASRRDGARRARGSCRMRRCVLPSPMSTAGGENGGSARGWSGRVDFDSGLGNPRPSTPLRRTARADLGANHALEKEMARAGDAGQDFVVSESE